jgi:hypothetical protein
MVAGYVGIMMTTLVIHTKYHAMKTYWGSEDTATRILKLSTR